MIQISAARTEQDLASARALFLEYAQSLGFDLCFQGFDEELAGLPGAYAPPGGRLLLAREDGRSVGCVALRPLDAGACEMKRLYIQPDQRRSGLGRALARTILRQARAIGYERMLLDTVPSMVQAIALYRSLGFEEVAAYRHNPIPGAIFMATDLQRERRDIFPAVTDEDLEGARSLLREYESYLAGHRHPTSSVAADIEGLPGEYAPPGGAILLAEVADEVVGCVFLRRSEARACEMRRLYVRPGRRGQGIGPMLVRSLCERSRAMGYAQMRLVSLPFMKEARSLYATLGFREVAAYRPTLAAEVIFMEAELGPDS